MRKEERAKRGEVGVRVVESERRRKKSRRDVCVPSLLTLIRALRQGPGDHVDRDGSVTVGRETNREEDPNEGREKERGTHVCSHVRACVCVSREEGSQVDGE